MNFLISQDQAAFVPNRAIHDNIIIAHEVFHYLKTFRSKSKVVAIKLDMYKAYDKVEWSFL